MNGIINVKLSDLKLKEDNVRIHPKNQIREYMRSLEMFGQTKNAVIDEDNNVLIGNGLVMAAQELGWEEIFAIRKTGLSENDKLKIMVSDNKIYGLGIDNLDALDEIFHKLIGDLDIPGYDMATLETMVAEADKVSVDIAGYGRLSQDEITSIQNRPSVSVPPLARSSENQPDEKSEQSPVSSDSGTGADEKVPIKCPHCEETIWLSKDALRQLLS